MCGSREEAARLLRGIFKENETMKRWLTLVASFSLLGWAADAKDYRILSPDGRTEVVVSVDRDIRWKVSRDGQTVILPSEMALVLDDGTVLGVSPRVKSAKTASVDKAFPTPVYHKSEIRDCYNQLVLKMAGDFSVEYRAYDTGAAYRFITSRKGGMTVKDECVNFRFDKDYAAFIPYVNDNRGGERYCYSFESYYTEVPMSRMVDDSLSIVPYIVDLGSGKKVAVMEAGAEDYPGMFLKINTADRQSLAGEFAPYPLEYGLRGRYTVPVRRADYIARTEGTRTFPWRVLAVADRDIDLLENDLAQCLAPECRLEDVSWIKPGKTSWEWWSGIHVTGVDFRAGINTETYRYFVDFSADNGLEYILIDAGWSAGSLMNVRPGLDLKAIVDYAASKNVGVVLWCHASSAEAEAAQAFPHYAQMGVKGFKVDFFDADDQRMNGVMYKLAALAAENHLILDLHGMKAFGIQRPYPNVLNFEGVKGLENCQWTAVVNGRPVDDIPRYDVTAPYARMLIGPMDYTPGAMDNAIARSYHADSSSPMSMGTRVHQMAMYSIFDAPYQMLADSPSKYKREQECTDFIAKVPTVFDRTVGVDGKVGEYIVVAREKDGVWYVGAMTDWTPRDLEIDFSFLDEGTYQADVFADGINADRAAEDYRHSSLQVVSGDKVRVHLAPGGGWTAILRK